MKRLLSVLCLAVLLAAPLSAQTADTTQAAPAVDTTLAVPATETGPSTAPPPQQQAAATQQQKWRSDRIYFGGTVGLTFGDYFRISVAPLVGYKLMPMVSVGATVQYEYIENKRYDPKVTSSNYGGSVFTRVRLSRKVYAHGEFSYMSYKWGETDRDWVPFLWLGGGIVQPLARGTSLYAQVLVDVLQDSKSPYEDWNPFFSVGVVAGF